MHPFPRRRIAVVFAVAFSLVFPAAAAIEYFVSLAGCDETHDGRSRDRAFASIQRGVDALAPGDTLTILPGEYAGGVRRDGLGSDATTTTIRADRPGTAVLRGDMPVGGFREAEGFRFVQVADFDFDGAVAAVNELDTLTILSAKLNPAELEFFPGAFHHDREAGRLYVSTSDLRDPANHVYTVSIVPTHGLYLSNARHVVIEGLAVTGFNALELKHHRERSGGSVWGIFLANGRHCVIRDCRAWLNPCGIGLHSGAADSGDNRIERCVAWGNRSAFGGSDAGGLTGLGVRRDVIRDSAAFLNGGYGVNIYGTGTDGGVYGEWRVPGNEPENRSRLVRNLAWGNRVADVKIKTGVKYFHAVEHSVAPGLWSVRPENVTHSVIGRRSRDYSADNINLSDDDDLERADEFADPDHHDYRLQATSRFRGAGPDGTDAGPFPFAADVFFVKPDGDDSADGLSVVNAWRTPARAFQDLTPGDTLYLLPGVYTGDMTLTLPDRASPRPVSLRGRGNDPVVIVGELRLEGAGPVELKRLTFARALRVAGHAATATGNDAPALRIENCRFEGAPVGVTLQGVPGVRLNHCEFEGFSQAALVLRECSGVDLRGNWFDNDAGIAVQLDDAGAIVYAGYNGYRNVEHAWNRDVEAHHAATFSRADPARNTAGPYHTRLGRHHFAERDARMLEMAGPFLHSTGAASANVEWWACSPAHYRLDWGRAGDGDGLTNRVQRFAHQAASFSLAGLAPDTEYQLRITPDRPLSRINDDTLAGVTFAPESVTIAFRTQTTPSEPRTYYVATDGDDGNSGLQRDQAWATVARAADRVRPGDTVRVAGGAYREAVWLRVTGEAGRPITFKALAGEKVTFDGHGRTLDHAFMTADKHHLRFDAFYFTGLNHGAAATPFRLSRAGGSNGAFVLYRSDDVQITRCFLDGRGAGYSPGLLFAKHCTDLVVRNNVIVSSMGGGVTIWWDSLRARVMHNVFLRGLISQAGIHIYNHRIRTPEDNGFLQHNIITDNLAKKVQQSLIGGNPVMRENCFFLRVPPEERTVGGGQTYADLLKGTDAQGRSLGNIVADPRFAGDPGIPPDDEGRQRFVFDRMMHAHFPLDFDFLFARNPELIKKGIGLQPEAFADFHFNREDQRDARPTPSDVVWIAASHNPQHAARMVDGNPRTGWSSAVAQETGMWLEVRFAHPRTTPRLTLDWGSYPPFSCAVYVDEGEGFQEPPALQSHATPGVHVVALDRETPVVGMRFVIVDPDAEQRWSVRELTLDGRLPVSL